MQYRKFGKLDWQVSALGFGAMRFPIIDNDRKKIDEPEAIRMIRYAIDNGVNYIDTAYPYHGGESERVVGLALKDGYREKVKLATKLPSWAIKTSDDLEHYFNIQLERLQTDYIDFYLLHAMREDWWANLQNLDIFSWTEKLMKEGRIHYLGFSFHDELPLFKKIVDAYDNWTLCQIQYNYMDINFQAGTEGLKYAADKGLAMVIMEPLLGGQLTKKSLITKELWENASNQRTLADWGLQWLWNQKEVSTVLSGMSNMQQVEENIISAENSSIDSLTNEELETINKVREDYKERLPIPCTNCKYCIPCPSGVKIPQILEMYNDAFMYDDYERAGFYYNAMLKPEYRADLCVECGQCEEACPQGIKIMEWLKKIHTALYKEPPPE